MARPNKPRRVSSPGAVTEFRPLGVAESELRTLLLRLDGLEALRLAELLGLDQAEAARRMGVSRQTFGRVLASARRVLAQAVLGGFALRIAPEDPACAALPVPPPPARVAVSTHAAALEAAVAPRFGRAPGFLLVDPASLAWEYLPHDPDRPQGRGTDAAALLARAGIGVVLTGFVGAQAAAALAAAGVRVIDGLGALSVREAVERYARGELTSSTNPTERTLL